MNHIEKSIEVDVPVSQAYNQWTQFEEFPHFMEGVKEVRQLDDKRLHWKAEIAGRDKEWDAEITLQEPDRVIKWSSIGGTPNAGEVHFAPIDPTHTRVTLLMDYMPEGGIEKTGAVLHLPEMRVEGDLKRFKEFIESRGTETGAWRGRIN